MSKFDIQKPDVCPKCNQGSTFVLRSENYDRDMQLGASEPNNEAKSVTVTWKCDTCQKNFDVAYAAQ